MIRSESNYRRAPIVRGARPRGTEWRAAVCYPPMRLGTVVTGSPRGMRDAISQAEVLLSKRFRITTADAYALLLRLSARQELPVRSAAEQIVDERRATTTRLFLEQ
jgi:ANTAR domain